MQGELWGLGLEEFTIGEMFQEYGYKTHAIGLSQPLPGVLIKARQENSSFLKRSDNVLLK